MSHDGIFDLQKHVRTYITIFVALAFLTVVTVTVSYLHLAVPAAIAVALVIATFKGSLVACYFMHLISEKKLIYVVLIFTVLFFVVLLFIPVMTDREMVGINASPEGALRGRLHPALPVEGATRAPLMTDREMVGHVS